MTQPNPFNNTSDSLKGVIDAARDIIQGSPSIPDQFSSHADAAADEIGKIDGPVAQDDITKIMQKHFNDASKGEPQKTGVQKAFDTEVNKRIHQSKSAQKWEEH